MPFVYYNGQLVTEESVRISPINRAFRYADGFFETLKFINGAIALEAFHVKRLYATLETLKFKPQQFPTASTLMKQIEELVVKNELSNCSRVRITVFAGDGLLYQLADRFPNYIIQTLPLIPNGYPLNDLGIAIDFFRDAVKSSDLYSQLKTNNCLPYVMAAIWANENNLDDALLLNAAGTVADSTIANIFIIKDGLIKTPPLSDGPVAGVMRNYLITCFKKNDIPFIEASIAINDVLQATEVFFTNAISGIRWVDRAGESRYTCSMTKSIHEKFLKQI